MAKEQQRGNKESKKPKGDKPKGPGSVYKQAQAKSGQATIAPVRKNSPTR